MTTLAFEGNITVSPPTRSWISSGRDRALAAWVKGADVAPAKITGDQLLELAEEKLRRLTVLRHGWDGHRGQPVQPLPAMALAGILALLLFDDAASPQIAAQPDGGVDVEWLVAGDSLHMAVSPDGEVVVWANRADGSIAFEGDFHWYRPDNRLIRDAERYLKEISKQVRVRAEIS